MSKYKRLSKIDLCSDTVDHNELWQDLINENFIDDEGKKLEKALEIKNQENIGLTSAKNEVAFNAFESAHLYANDKKYGQNVVDEFLQRLKNILQYGLWMTKHRGKDDKIREFPKPKVSRVCFTELKISDSLLHADKFGPMGIGFKRLFVTNRHGSPVFYIPAGGFHPIISETSNWYNPNNKKLKDIKPEDVDERFALFKDMSSGECAQGYITYDLYDESEWRILFSENIKEKLPCNKQKYFIDPIDPSCETKYKDFYKSLGNNFKPDYLVPVDEWLSLIIYPNLQIKNASFDDEDIRKLLKQLKNPNENKMIAEHVPPDEARNFPIEVAIGDLKNI